MPLPLFCIVAFIEVEERIRALWLCRMRLLPLFAISYMRRHQKNRICCHSISYHIDMKSSITICYLMSILVPLTI